MVFYLGRFIRRNEKKTLCTVSVPVHGDDSWRLSAPSQKARKPSPDWPPAEASVTSVNPVETPDTHITFKFYNGETLLDTQVVNDDGQLTAPATPAIGAAAGSSAGMPLMPTASRHREFNFGTAYTNYSGRGEVKVMAKIEGRVLRVLYDR